MQLLIFITNQTECINPILTDLFERKLGGATVVDCEGMVKALGGSDSEPPPMFGSLLLFLHTQHETGKMLFTVLEDAEVDEAKQVVRTRAGGLEQPGSGVMFTLPVTSMEGTANRHD